MHGSPVYDGGGPCCCRSPSPSSTLSPISVGIANVFRTAGTSVAYVASVEPPPGGTRKRKNTRRGRDRSKSGSGRSKNGVVPAPWSVLLGLGSVFVIAEDRYVVTNFHVVERAYNMTLGTEERNAYTVKFLLDVTEYIMGKRPPLLSMSLSEMPSSSPKSSSRSLLLSVSEMLANCTRSVLLKGANLTGGKPQASVYLCIKYSGNYMECRIAGVRPDLNVVVIKILDDEFDDDYDDKDNDKDGGRVGRGRQGR